MAKLIEIPADVLILDADFYKWDGRLQLAWLRKYTFKNSALNSVAASAKRFHAIHESGKCKPRTCPVCLLKELRGLIKEKDDPCFLPS